MNITKSQNVYEITDTYKDHNVTGTCAVDPVGNIAIHLIINQQEIFFNTYPGQDTCGINATIEHFDVDLLKYIIDITDIFINNSDYDFK